VSCHWRQPKIIEEIEMVISKRNWIAAASVAAMMIASSGCGYFLYPDRVGQTEGRIDPAVVALDAAALLFGIIPGVIAFAVDISTGTIYIPEGEESVVEKHQKRLTSIDALPLLPVDDDSIAVDEQMLAEKLTGQVGQPIDPDQISYYRSEQGTSVRLRPL
jgi:hypothetical protein